MHRLLCRSVAVLLLCAGYATADHPAYKLEIVDRHKVNASITYEIKTRQFAVTRWLIFLPEPPELPSQGGVKSKVSPNSVQVLDKSLLARKLRYIDVPVVNPFPGGGITMTQDIEATLRSRRLVPLRPGEKPPAVAALSANERKYYLAPTTRVDFQNRIFREWLEAKKLRCGKSEHPLEFAGRVLEVIRSDYGYHYDADEDKRASVACRTGKTDCAGMSYLFVGAMRASGIPARVLSGRLAHPRRPDSQPGELDYDHAHVRAEMYVSDIGWVPVEPAFARGNKSRPVSAFIGHDPGDLLVLHVDVDLKLPFPDRVRESQFLQLGPYYWTRGHGDFDCYFGPSGWDLRLASVRER